MGLRVVEIENGCVVVGVQGQLQMGYGVGVGDWGGLVQMVCCLGIGFVSFVKFYVIESNFLELFLKGCGLLMKIWLVLVEFKFIVGVFFFDFMNDILVSYVFVVL